MTEMVLGACLTIPLAGTGEPFLGVRSGMAIPAPTSDTSRCHRRLNRAEIQTGVLFGASTG